jgi:hypothetical protein
MIWTRATEHGDSGHIGMYVKEQFILSIGIKMEF